MPERILTEKQEKLLAEERELLSNLRVALARLAVPEDDQSTLEASIRTLDELFLLVVVGEFNAGKSVFINALLGEPLLEEGVTPTTHRILLLKYGETRDRTTRDPVSEVITAPAELLREVNIVDTPGTNAIQREHEAITRHFVPRSDMVLFVTSADRPFTESERAFLESIRDWGKKILVVVNKVDILETEEELARVEAFVRENVKKLLGVEPESFSVSARRALRAKTSGDDALLEQSRFPALEQHIVSKLDDRERVRLKLLNPVGVGLRLSSESLGIVGGQLELLSDDVRMLEEIERQLELYDEDRNREFRYRLADIDNALLDFENRGIAFFEETMRLARVLDLVNKSKMKSEFEHKVVGDLPQVVETRVGEVIDWMVSSELKQWKALTEYLEARRAQHADRLLGTMGGTLEYDRKRLLDSVGRAARRAIESYDKDKESTRLAESIQMSVASAALLEVGAVGLGTLVTLIASTTMVDFTGILAAGAMSVIGLLVIPARRREAKRELRRRVAEVREQLMSGLKTQFQRETSASLARLREAISPYTRFVRAEKERLSESREELSGIQENLESLKARIDSL